MTSCSRGGWRAADCGVAGVAPTVGGIGTNRKREVVDTEGNVIAGLYAAGLDGDMRYRNAYPINCGGTTFAGFLYNGRKAADNAKEYIASL